MSKRLLMGNEAIAFGALEAGVQVATAYPGTPASEVLATIAGLAPQYGVYAEWSVNEKVALETAAGAAYAGARALVGMKQVGLNVAADPLMTLAYIGVKGGLVLVVADDPGPHSSQNEQDTRLFARFAKLPVLDPASPAEAKEMTKRAFALSETLGLPVILRPTTRTCHVCQDVPVGEISPARQALGFTKDPGWTIMPGLAAKRHHWLNAQQEKARELFNASPFNQAVYRNRVGIITSGVSFNYVTEALTLLEQEASILKIGTPYPLPGQVVREFLGRVDRVLIVEEQEPVVEEQVISLAWREQAAVAVSGKHDRFVPREGELDVDKVRQILGRWLGLELAAPAGTAVMAAPALPLRAPQLCAGCPHRASFYACKQATKGSDAVFTGDIGCYTLGVMPPLNAVDTCLCMGASVSIAAGLAKAAPGRPYLAFFGDSTFFHTGIPGLVNAVYNQADITLVVLDNRTTAMTGFQPHPGTGRTAAGQPAKALNIARIAAACGVEFVREVDPFDLAAAEKAVREAVAFSGPAVIVFQQACTVLAKNPVRYRVNAGCVQCQSCIAGFGCPAISRQDGFPVITGDCRGCGVCAQICPVGAIEEVRP